MNYDYNNMETEKSKNFPYGTESIFVIQKKDILLYKAAPYENKCGKHCRIIIILRNDKEISVYFNNNTEVKEAMGILADNGSYVIIIRAKTKDDKSFQRDFITHSRNIYEDALDNL